MDKALIAVHVQSDTGTEAICGNDEKVRRVNHRKRGRNNVTQYPFAHQAVVQLFCELRVKK